MPEIDYTSGDSPSEVLDEFWRETLSGIRNGRWGSDIRTPIYDGVKKLLTEKEIPERTIEDDLLIIAGSIYGEEIRMAIYDALKKIHEEGGGSVEPEPFSYSDVIPISNGGVSEDICGIASQYPVSDSSYFCDNNPNDDSVNTITVEVNSLDIAECLLFVIYEDGDEPTISSPLGDWTNLHTFSKASGTSHLCAALYKDELLSGTTTITITKQNASTRFHAVARCFYDAMLATVVDSDTKNGLSSSTYTTSTPSGANRYYILASVNPSSFSFSCMIDTNGADAEQNSYKGILECYPYVNGSSYAPTFEFSGSGIQPSDMVFVGLDLV